MIVYVHVCLHREEGRERERGIEEREREERERERFDGYIICVCRQENPSRTHVKGTRSSTCLQQGLHTSYMYNLQEVQQTRTGL